MSIVPQSLTKAKVNVTADDNTDMFLRIKYLGTKSESICDSVKIKLRVMKPETPVLTINKANATVGDGATVTATPFTTPIYDIYVSTDWYIYSDAELTNRLDITPMTQGWYVLDLNCLMNVPSGDYYITCRHNGTDCGSSSFAEPVVVHWTGLNISEDFYAKQTTTFDLIKNIAIQKKYANATSYINGTSIIFRNVKAFDDPDLGDRQWGITVGSNGLITSATNITNRLGSTAGYAYEDTFTVTLSALYSAGGAKKGCFMVNATTPLNNIFDLEATGGKAVFDYDDGYNAYWIAYEGAAIQDNGKFYGIKKSSPLIKDMNISI